MHLTIGALALVALAWIFGSIAAGVTSRDPIVQLDQQLAEWFNQHGTPFFFRTMTVVSFFGSGDWIYSVSGLAALLLMWRRAWYPVLLLLFAIPCGGWLNVLLKSAFERERPVVAHPLVALESFSFPSGHTMGATLFYGLAVVFAFYWVRAWRSRVWIIAAASFVVFLVGLSRIAIGAHFLSDVVGAIAAGLAWLSICVTAIETLRRRRMMKTGAILHCNIAGDSSAAQP